MPEVKIAAETRDEFGKGAARRTRREGRVPAVLYGHGTETRHLTLPGHDLMRALRTSNALLRLEGLKNGSEIALPKAVQRDPLTGPPTSRSPRSLRRSRCGTASSIPPPSLPTCRTCLSATLRTRIAR